MEISKVLFHANCRTVIVNGAVLLNVQIMAPTNTKYSSKQGCNDGDRWKMFLCQTAAFGIIQCENTIMVMLTKRIFKALSGYAMTV